MMTPMKALRVMAAPVLLVALVAACAAGRTTPPALDGGDTADATADREPAHGDTSDAGEPSRDDGAVDAGDATTCATPCGIAPQCGCAAFETCDVSPTDASPVCANAGANPAGRACLGTFECARGLLCLSGVCRAPCDDALSPCGAGSCSPYAKAQTDGGASPSVPACSVSCDYGDEASCGFKPGDLVASACVLRPELGRVECMSVRNVQLQSGVCTTDAECGAARACVPTSMGFSSCRRMCKLGAGDACGGCSAFPTPRQVAGVTFGYCP